MLDYSPLALDTFHYVSVIAFVLIVGIVTIFAFRDGLTVRCLH